MGLLDPATETPAAGGSEAKVSAGSPEAVFGDGKPAPAIVETSIETSKPASQPAETQPVKVEAPAATQPSTVAMTDAQLTQLAQTMVAGMKPAAQPALQPDPNRPLTAEEQQQFDKEFNVVRVTPQLFQSIMGFAPENAEQLKHLENFAHGIVRQAAAMTMFRVQQFAQEREGKLTERLSPVLRSHQEAQGKQIEDAFYAKNADLVDWKDLVNEVALAEKARGTQFKSPQEAADFVANKARTLLGNRASSGTTQTSTTQRTNTTQKPSMPTTSVGGRSGSGGSPQPASGPRAVFGDLDGNRS